MDTLESLRAVWEQHRNYDPYALIVRLFAVLEDAEQKLGTYREWHLENRRQVNALREVLIHVKDDDLHNSLDRMTTERIEAVLAATASVEAS